MTARRILRWTGWIALGIVGLVAVALASTYGLSEARMERKFVVPDHPIAVRSDSAALALGGRLAKIRGCAECHGSDLGGAMMIDDPMLGRLAPPNITRGGRGAELEARDWERAVRHAVRRDGGPLRIMPAHEFTTMSDDDLGAIIGYAQSVPPVTRPTPPLRVGPVIRALFLAGQVELLPAELVDHSRAHVAHVDAEPTAKYGEYLAAGCKGCHGTTLSGGKIPGTPPEWKPAANLTPAGIGRYSEDDFIRILRTGTRPDGSMIDSTMPWRLTKEMTDVELKAVFAYLKTVPPKPYGNR
jgi:mono/diheme cytochrome c family protein